MSEYHCLFSLYPTHHLTFKNAPKMNLPSDIRMATLRFALNKSLSIPNVKTEGYALYIHFSWNTPEYFWHYPSSLLTTLFLFFHFRTSNNFPRP